MRPTYLVDAPVVEDRASVELLSGLQDNGRAEIGAHVHPWCNPPRGEELNARNSYLCNLPESLQRDKITWLTEAIEARFGRRPTSFRAGRYGLDIAGARILHGLGYLVDSSVTPFTDHSRDGGPNFTDSPWMPYPVRHDHLLVANAERTSSDLTSDDCLLEVPVTVGYSRPDFRRADALRRRASRTPWNRLRCAGILDRLGLARRIRLCPEQADARSMKALIDRFTEQSAPCVVLIFHSSSLVPGLTPYVRDEADQGRFYRRLEVVFEHALRRNRLEAATLSEFARMFRSTASPPHAERISASRAPMRS